MAFQPRSFYIGDQWIKTLPCLMIRNPNGFFSAFFPEPRRGNIALLMATVTVLLAQPPSAYGETVREFYPNGKIRFERDADPQQLPHGISREFDENGNRIAERNYEHGILQGISRLYYPTGQVKTEWIYQNGKREGISLGYYKSGKIKDRGFYVNDKLNGTVRFFFPDGTLKSELHFENDRTEGPAKTWHPNGALEYLYEYRNGQLVRRKNFDHEGNLIQDQEFPQSKIQP
ncbi:hypothetical protein UR09_06405 [Candidatus Nitromaritima sp. SCGC AAA799-A02]|nr:hypothetical protein UR09_06405 [Candidatus Nitromaritima sp. SCGC AAA799-A02]